MRVSSSVFQQIFAKYKSCFCGKSFQLTSKSILTNSCTIFKPASSDHVTSVLLLFVSGGAQVLPLLSLPMHCSPPLLFNLCNEWRRRLYGWCALRAPLRPGHAAGPNFGSAGCRVRGRASRALAGTRLCFDYFLFCLCCMVCEENTNLSV